MMELLLKILVLLKITRVLEGDKGKNTGGMGAYSPSRLINKELENKIINKIIKPTMKGLSDLTVFIKDFCTLDL